MKRFSLLLVAIIMMLVIPYNAHAVLEDDASRLSDASDEEIRAFLEEYRVEIPGGEDNLDYWMEFVRNTIEIVENNGKVESTYNWPATQIFSEKLESAIQEYYGIVETNITTYSSSGYTLQDSEAAVSSWLNSYYHYNCYTYALRKSDDWRYIGFSVGLDGDYYENNPMPSIVNLKNYVISDLKSSSLGYNCVKCTTTRPSSSSIPSGARVICLRSGTYDFHFMRLSGSSWYHKPSSTLPLRYLHSSPSATIWTNECIDEYGVHHEGGIQYDSTIYYFVYQSSHSYETSSGGEDYHSANQHYYKVLNTCVDCGDSFYTWDVLECNGPPCLDYSPYAHDDFELVEE